MKPAGTHTIFFLCFPWVAHTPWVMALPRTNDTRTGYFLCPKGGDVSPAFGSRLRGGLMMRARIVSPFPPPWHGSAAGHTQQLMPLLVSPLDPNP